MDRPLLARRHTCRERLIDAFDDITDFGRSGWFLFRSAPILLALLVARLRRGCPGCDRGVLAAFAVRLSFLFVAIAPAGPVRHHRQALDRPGAAALGRRRVCLMPLSGGLQYASLPSGHATTAFAALVAIGALFPEARRADVDLCPADRGEPRRITLIIIRAMCSRAPSSALSAHCWCATGTPRAASGYRRTRGAVRPMPGPSLGSASPGRLPDASAALPRTRPMTGSSTPDLSVVVPVRNEARNVAPLVAEIGAR